jgi:predicted dinucleotide-binding enzyme
LATAIIGVGNLGSALARNLVAGDELVVLAAADEAHARALADELGPNATSASAADAIAGADVVVSLGANQLASGANREPRIVLFYATDDDAAEATARRLIRAAGLEPLKVGGASDAGRIEGPDGDLQGRTLDLDQALSTVATEGVRG